MIRRVRIAADYIALPHRDASAARFIFITSGAFHLSKPSDLIPELQGRLPIRVELQALTPDDFERILTGRAEPARLSSCASIQSMPVDQQRLVYHGTCRYAHNNDDH